MNTQMLTAVIAGCSDSGTSGQNAAGAEGAQRPPSPVSVVVMKKAEHPLTSLLPADPLKSKRRAKADVSK